MMMLVAFERSLRRQANAPKELGGTTDQLDRDGFELLHTIQKSRLPPVSGPHDCYYHFNAGDPWSCLFFVARMQFPIYHIVHSIEPIGEVCLSKFANFPLCLVSLNIVREATSQVLQVPVISSTVALFDRSSSPSWSWYAQGFCTDKSELLTIIGWRRFARALYKRRTTSDIKSAFLQFLMPEAIASLVQY